MYKYIFVEIEIIIVMDNAFEQVMCAMLCCVSSLLGIYVYCLHGMVDTYRFVLKKLNYKMRN